MPQKNPAAVRLGKLSGSRMTAEQRTARARKAGQARALKAGQKLRTEGAIEGAKIVAEKA